jgi:hypothetical protein
MAVKSKPAAKAKSASLVSKTASKGPKYVYTWGAGRADGDGSMKPLLGGKGANLAEMTRIGLPVPPGFTITTEVCTYYYANKRSYPSTLQACNSRSSTCSASHSATAKCTSAERWALFTAGAARCGGRWHGIRRISSRCNCCFNSRATRK